MCLWFKKSTQTKVLKSEFPIYAYKALVEISGKLYSPYQAYEYPLDEVVCSPLNLTGPENLPRVTEGLHTFTRLSDAAWVAPPTSPRAQIYPAIIPKGSLYYYGFDDDGTSCYASDKLLILPRTTLWFRLQVANLNQLLKASVINI